MIGIYKITNLTNGKAYIGQSTNIPKRWIWHKSPSHWDGKYPIYRAILKYGIDNFSFEILELCTVDKLNVKEIEYISLYDTYLHGYNSTLGGYTRVNGNSLTAEDVVEIKNILATTTLSQEKIGDLFQVSHASISGINTGDTWRDDSTAYPIRKEPITVKKEHYCKDCGVTIDSTSTLCWDCYTLSRRTALRPVAIDLARMVCEYGFEKTGAIYGVSGNSIKKWCMAYNIPHIKKNLLEWYLMNV